MQLRRSRTILREGSDPLYASDERFHLVGPAYAIQPEAADRERAVGECAITRIERERRGSHRMAWRLKRLDGDVAAGDSFTIGKHDVRFDHRPRSDAGVG